MASHVALRGSRPVHPKGAAPVRRSDPDRRIQVTVVLQPPRLTRNHPLARKALAHDAAWPTERPTLSRSEIAAIYAPRRDVVRAIVGIAKKAGLTVVDASEPRHDVILEGPIAAFDKTYRIRQQEYEHEVGRYRAHTGPIHLPGQLSDLVQGVLGLDSVPHARPHALAAPGRSSAIRPADLAAHYDFPRAAAHGGHRVALLEFGGGVHAEDLLALARRTGAPIRVLSITDGEGNTPGNVPLGSAALHTIMGEWRAGLSLAGIGARHGPSLMSFMDTVEATMDVEIVCGLLHGTPVDLVFASPTADGWRRALYAQLGFPYPGSVSGRPRRADDLPAAISISWGMSESGWGRMKLQVLHGTLEVAMRRDVTVCCSTGDFGSRNSPAGSDVYSVNYPASSPWALACGGTALVSKTRRTFDEVAWRESLLGIEMAGGGGMSGFFATPPFQVGVRTPAPGPTWRAGTPTSFRGRWLPDVAAHAGFSPGIGIHLLGEPFTGGGTSAATPIWAALVARLSSRIGRPLGWLNPALYRLGRGEMFHDIRRGNNDLSPRRKKTRRYLAGSGWDPCTGLGAPRGATLLRALLDGRPSY